MQKIQRIRGRVAHAGKRSLNREDAPYLRKVVMLACVAIHVVADLVQTHQWEKFDKLRDYLDDLKFAGANEEAIGP